MALATGLVYGFLAITSQESIAQSSLQVSQAQISIAGEWNSSEGRIGFVQSGANVSGAYEMLEGLIDGKMSGNVLTGYWSQERSLILARCETPRRGRYVWGRIKFVFSNDRINGAVFRGYWGYCNKEPTFSWSGFRSRSWFGAPTRSLDIVPESRSNNHGTKEALVQNMKAEQTELKQLIAQFKNDQPRAFMLTMEGLKRAKENPPPHSDFATLSTMGGYMARGCKENGLDAYNMLGNDSCARLSNFIGKVRVFSSYNPSIRGSGNPNANGHISERQIIESFIEAAH